jgi:hypothetical protein
LTEKLYELRLNQIVLVARTPFRFSHISEMVVTSWIETIGYDTITYGKI